MRLCCLIALLCVPLSVRATGLTFTFADGTIVEQTADANCPGTSCYRVDVQVAASDATTAFQDGQALVNYNTAAFGSNVVANGKVAVFKGALVSGAAYTLTTADNAAGRLFVGIEYTSGTAATVPTVEVAPGVHMPQLNLGTCCVQALGRAAAVVQGRGRGHRHGMGLL